MATTQNTDSKKNNLAGPMAWLILIIVIALKPEVAPTVLAILGAYFLGILIAPTAMAVVERFKDNRKVR